MKILAGIVIIVVLLISIVATLALPKQQPGPQDAPGKTPTPAANELRLVFTYGSEKEQWIRDCVTAFHATQPTTSSGKRISVEAVAMGSGECMDEVLRGTRQAHLVSPASAVFITQANATARASNSDDIVKSTDNLVLSPVVLAMWKPMAEALGWPGKPVGWKDVLAIARNPQGWAALGHPEWGAFRFGHTHPEYSNSGLISVLAECYAGAGKVSGLSIADLAKPEVIDLLTGIEQSVVHYGRSTGFFATRMMANGPRYLSCAVLYENNIVEAAARTDLAFPLVAIYPTEGTFWSDHPVGVVERPWVTPEHRQAAKQFIRFLLDAPQQQSALRLGFRPGDPKIAVGAPIDAAHGCDPAQPQTTLDVPTAEVVAEALRLWKEHKKPSRIALVFDTSGSMNDQGRIVAARKGAVSFVEMLGARDDVQLIPFSSAPRVQPMASIATQRAALISQINGLFPDGGTALYDSIDVAYRSLAEQASGDRITAVVVLTDGEDTDSRMSLEALLNTVRATSEKRGIRIFTIAYGSGAKRDVLKRIAEATQARDYSGDARSIDSVFKDIVTFF